MFEFESIIEADGLTPSAALICTGLSVAFGLVSAGLYRLGSRNASKSLMVTLIILPALIQAIIMLVSGSIGAGIAVMGAFNLIRFRSAPGSAKDICYIFYDMCIGIATGLGYIDFAALIAICVGIILVVLNFVPFFKDRRRKKLLRILIPENLDYTGIFDDIFKEYLVSSELMQVKTTAMGTLFDLRYEVTEKDAAREKEMLDKLRTRNGNLTISIGIVPESNDNL